MYDLFSVVLTSQKSELCRIIFKPSIHLEYIVIIR